MYGMVTASPRHGRHTCPEFFTRIGSDHGTTKRDSPAAAGTTYGRASRSNQTIPSLVGCRHRAGERLSGEHESNGSAGRAAPDHDGLWAQFGASPVDRDGL